MKGDFSRLTFEPQKHYRAVYMQQGRVQLDADWNEQVAILNYQLETHLRDLLGSGGAPQATAGFKIGIVDSSSQKSPSQSASLDFSMSSGRYYVDGILCENERDCTFSTQPDYPRPQLPPELDASALVYLDVWMRHITSYEDPQLREIALGGIDTTTRVQTVWQAKVLPLGSSPATNHGYSPAQAARLPEWQELLSQSARKGRLSARHTQRGSVGNQLYRVEIHDADEAQAAFKWSRENGSVVFAVADIAQLEHKNGSSQFVVTLNEPPHDRTQLRKGDWVEFVDDASELDSQPLPLYQVVDLPDASGKQLTLGGKRSPQLDALEKEHALPRLLRRWDQGSSRGVKLDADGCVPLKEDAWLDLEQGVQIRFSPGGTYAAGDYWLIPARTLAETLEWPTNDQGPLALPPQGVQHHYCPLALLRLDGDSWKVTKDLRQFFTTLPGLSTEEDVVEHALTQEQKTHHKQNGKGGSARSLVEECVSEEHLAMGDLVSFVPLTKRSVIRTNRENERLLFGVVSGEETVDGEKRYQITVYGRAHCKVAGPVEWGDMLKVSHESGHAHVLPREEYHTHHGAILGKALDSYHPDKGDQSNLIEVMVMLQ